MNLAQVSLAFSSVVPSRGGVDPNRKTGRDGSFNEEDNNSVAFASASGISISTKIHRRKIVSIIIPGI